MRTIKPAKHEKTVMMLMKFFDLYFVNILLVFAIYIFIDLLHNKNSKILQHYILKAGHYFDHFWRTLRASRLKEDRIENYFSYSNRARCSVLD